MQHADVAMYLAKGKRTGYEVYQPSDDDADASRLKLAGDLRDAVDRHELVLHYQPKVNLRSGRVIGAEALMRWHHPGQGLLMPDRFIPLAERSGLIRSLTVFAIETAVRECRRWIDAGALTERLGQPLDPRPDRHPAARRRRHACCKQWRVPASSLELEITESVLMADPTRAREVVVAAGRVGSEGLDRRLRLGILVAGLSQPARRQRPQDRQVVRAQHDRGRRRRRDRAVDHRPGPQPRTRRSWPRASRPSRPMTAYGRWAATPPRATSSAARCPAPS